MAKQQAEQKHRTVMPSGMGWIDVKNRERDVAKYEALKATRPLKPPTVTRAREVRP